MMRGERAYSQDSVTDRRSDRLRIVSLLPAATEIICALGAEEELVGVSHECDFPPAVRNRPVLTAARIAPGGPIESINVAVRSIVADALSIFSVNEARLAELRPDVIVTQDLCEVCAVSLDDVRRAAARLANRDEVRIVSLRPMSLPDVIGDIERVAKAIGHTERGNALQVGLATRMNEISKRATAAVSRPRVVTIEWLEPLMLGGTWMPELVELAGGEPVGAKAGKLALTVRPEKLQDLRPDLVLIKPCGFSLNQTINEMELIERQVVQNVPTATSVCLSDGSAFFNRPGPRLVESLEILAACTHPALFEDFSKKHGLAFARL